jgi:hypothetical protein
VIREEVVMPNWSRDHRRGAGQVLARVQWIGGNPQVSVVGSGDRAGVVAYLTGGDDDGARARADEIVAADFDHTVCVPGCEAWRQTEE